MPAKAMTAPGVPITPWKHIQASQDAVAMNASRSGSAATASRQRQIGKCGAAGGALRATSGSAGVVSKRDGRRHIVVLAPARGVTLVRCATTRFGGSNQ